MCSVAVGLLVRVAFGGILGSSVPYITLYPAVAFSAVYGGLGPGLVATFLSLGSMFYFILPALHHEADMVRAGLFFGFCLIFSLFSEALARSRARSARDRDLLSVTLSSIGDAVISTDAGGNIAFLNTVAEQLTGWSQADAAGKPISEVFVISNEKTGLPTEIPVDKVLRDGAVVNLANHTVLRSRDGRATPIEDSAAPIYGEGRRVLGVVLVFRDVTERRKSELAVQRSEERLKLALDAGKIGVWDWDIAADRVAWSDQVYDILGVGRPTFAGTLDDFLNLVHREDRDGIREAVRAALEDGAPYMPEFRAIHPEKGVRWLACSGEVHRNEQGEPVRMIGSLSDITERKQAEEQLRRQYHTFDTALSNTPDFNYVFDLQGRFAYANRARLVVFQKTREEVLGKNFHDLGYPKHLAERFLSEIQQVIDTRQPFRGESPMTWQNGVTRQYEYIFVPVLSAEGEVEAVAGTTHDITELKEVEERLRTSEERLSLALDAGGGVGAWDWDVPNDRVYANRRFALLYSVDPDRAAKGVPLGELMEALHPEDVERAAKSVQTALDTGGDFEGEFRVVQKNGPVCWLYARGRCHVDADGKPTRFPGVAFDITGRKRAEQALRASQDQLRAIYGAMYEYIGVLSRDGKVLDCNPASLKFANNRIEDVLGKPFWETPWFTSTPGMPDVVKGAVAQVARGEFVRTEMTLLRPSGEARIFDFSMYPIRNETGEVVSMVPEGRDITDLKRAEEELQRSNDELTRVNRELEEFAYVASHDFQEPLRMVNIYTELIMNDLDRGGTSVREYAAFVRQGVKRMEGLIQDLLTFSRAVHSDRLPVGAADLSASLSEALLVLKNRIEESSCRITAEPLPTVRGDVSQLAHVFQNLLSNALKYCQRGAAPAIEIRAQRDGVNWIISIRDHGIGFEQQYAERIFGLFKRLHKDEYPGTGLGLAICKRIVERYGGKIWAEGKPGEGATFYFSLPQ